MEQVWPDWAINWTLGKILKPLAKINLPKSITILGNFCKGVKIYHFWATFIDIWRFFLVTLDGTKKIVVLILHRTVWLTAWGLRVRAKNSKSLITCASIHHEKTNEHNVIQNFKFGFNCWSHPPDRQWFAYQWRWVWSTATRFSEISPLRHNFKSLGQIFESLFSIWQNVNLTLTKM